MKTNDSLTAMFPQIIDGNHPGSNDCTLLANGDLQNCPMCGSLVESQSIKEIVTPNRFNDYYTVSVTVIHYAIALFLAMVMIIIIKNARKK